MNTAKRINNSYESESSSSYTSDQTLEKSLTDDNPLKLPDILNPQISHVDDLNDSLSSKYETNFINKHSSQESDFEGYEEEMLKNRQQYKQQPSAKEITDYSSNTRNHVYAPPVFEANSYLNPTPIKQSNSTSNSNFPSSAESVAISDQDLKISRILNGYKKAQHNSAYVVDSAEIRENKSYSPKRVYMVNSDENSCNAVDNKLSNETEEIGDLKTELSFNGKIDKNCQNNFQNITTTSIMYTNEKSPNMFEEDDSSDDDDVINEIETSLNKSNNANETEIDKIEKEILKRMQNSLSGMLPPPVVTTPQFDIKTMLKLFEENKEKYFVVERGEEEIDSLFTPNSCPAEIIKMTWPEMLTKRTLGVCYNRTIYTDDIETVSLKYLDRYVGSETSSSFISTDVSSAKKKAIKMKLLSQSPGRRLSHLAKRRSMFSSANLLMQKNVPSTSSGVSSSQPNPVKVVNRQILLNPLGKQQRGRSQRMKIKTPKRRTPGRRKTPGRKTPSSARKQLEMQQQVKPVSVSRETSKRALFQSPAKVRLNRMPSFTPEIANRVDKSRRVLFSPNKFGKNDLFDFSSQRSDYKYSSMNNLNDLDTSCSSTSSIVSNKRKRENDEYKYDCERRVSMNDENLTPTSLKFARSQSFCVGAPQHQLGGGKPLMRTTSEIVLPNLSQTSTILSESHKKKLLWAVSQALQQKQICLNNPNFKKIATVLARASKKLFLEFESPGSGNTSDKMLKLTNRLVYSAIQGKTADEIYFTEVVKIRNAQNNLKPTGYIGPEEYEKKNLQKYNSCNIFPDNSSTMESFNLSQLSLSQLGHSSQSTEFINQFSQNLSSQIAKVKNGFESFQPTVSQNIAALTKSTSKNNENSNVLRENCDIELKQKSSGQKNIVGFSGKDQKNVSPYSVHKQSKLLVGAKSASVLKAKRQISFDT